MIHSNINNETLALYLAKEDDSNVSDNIPPIEPNKKPSRRNSKKDENLDINEEGSAIKDEDNSKKDEDSNINGDTITDSLELPKPVKRRQKKVKVIDENEHVLNEDNMLAQIPHILPVLPLRDHVVFNSMVVPLYEAREKSILAIEQSFLHSKFIFLSTQKDATVENPTSKDLFEVGTVALILRILKMPGGELKILLQGVARAKMATVLTEDPYISAQVDVLTEKKIAVGKEEEALMRTAKEQSEKILQLRGLPVADIMNILTQINEPGRIADLIASHMRFSIEDAQKFLECIDGMERLEFVNTHLMREVEIADIQARIQNTARESMDKAQKTYFLREQLKVIRKELGDDVDADEELDSIRRAIEKVGLSKEAKKEAEKQLHRLSSMGNESAEANVIRTYLDWLIELPWRKTSKDSLDIKKAKILLDEDHFGLEFVKDRILEFLSVRKLNPSSKGSILCFVGPPGVGKTSLGRSIARAMNRKFQRISLGGIRDESEIRGHRRTYIGSMPGRIIQAVKQAGTRNPVVLLDEIDKLGNDFRGDPSSALLEALDPEQNSNFSDHYLNVPFDLSKVLFLCTANSLESIPSALRDRLEVIQLSGYTEFEKLSIAKKYLIKRQVKENGLQPKHVKFSENILRQLIREYTREAGLRNLEREIGRVCRKIARSVAEGKKAVFNITNKQLAGYLGVPRFIEEDRDSILIPGVAVGLAWTAAGGDVLYVEVSLMKGKGSLSLTGQLGDVMKESAQAALSFIRAHAEQLGLDTDFHEKFDFHIHVPAGATPKDGPSAGVTIVSALVSALLNKPIRNDLCMTGEISLRGRVLPVGGIKEKVIAAVGKELSHVIMPKQNIKDLEDIPKDLLAKITVHGVSTISEVLDLIFIAE